MIEKADFIVLTICSENIQNYATKLKNEKY